MISRHTYKKLTWIDVQDPTQAEVSHLAEEHRLPAAVAEELTQKTVRSKVDLYPDLIYLVLHFPCAETARHGEEDEEVDFIVGRDRIITVHHGQSGPLHRFAKSFEVDALLERGLPDEHAGYLFYAILKELYHDCLEELDDINRTLREIERGIFSGREEETVEVVSRVNRRLLDFRQAIRFHQEVLASFEVAGRRFFGEEFAYHLSAIAGEHRKVQAMLDGHKEILNDLRDTNDSLLSTKTNETIKTLTILSFIMLPLTLIASVFGMNVSFALIESSKDFAVVLGSMAGVAMVMYAYFKLKRWI